ncbi:MAG: hypothetical protein H6622_15390 [Halobacteriovoraceae bacterium]|nr:hypothetical protein [Halobacteriovoraceae bacterium]
MSFGCYGKHILKLSFFVALCCQLLADDQAKKIVSSKHFSHPKREVSVIIGPESYYPNKFLFYKNEEVTFYFTSINSIASCVLFPKYQLYLGVKKNEIIEQKIVFDEEGIIEFYCPTGNIKSQITVIEHPELTRERERKRELAGQKKKVWMPE